MIQRLEKKGHTCSVWLHENSYAMAGKETALHSHSEDEVIFAAKTYFKVNKVEKLATKLNTGADVVIHLEEWEDL